MAACANIELLPGRPKELAATKIQSRVRGKQARQAPCCGQIMSDVHVMYTNA